MHNVTTNGAVDVTLDKLQQNRPYNIRVAAYNDHGIGVINQLKTFTTKYKRVSIISYNNNLNSVVSSDVQMTVAHDGKVSLDKTSGTYIVSQAPAHVTITCTGTGYPTPEVGIH
jgi:hypothetical protein